jgi:Ca2+-binding RTX toxin-like protein
VVVAAAVTLAGPEATVASTVADAPPTIVSVRGGTCSRWGQAGVRMEISDPDDDFFDLRFSVRSSNPGVVQGGDVVYLGYDRPLVLWYVTPGRAGSAVLTFTVSDGTSKASLMVGYRAGGAGDDVLTGTTDRDLLMGYGGDDRIDGAGGDDVLCGGNGADRLRGQAGEDVVDGHGGDDVLSGGTGRDSLRGGQGDDRMSGGPRGDRFVTGTGHNTLVDFSPAEGDVRFAHSNPRSGNTRHSA